MKDTRILMGMPITVEVIDTQVTQKDIDTVFSYFSYIDNTFSIYKEESEISRINKGKLDVSQAADDVKTIFALAEKTKQATDGYFDIKHKGSYDPSGIVKGWAIYNAAQRLKNLNFKNYYVEAGGDIQAEGLNAQEKPWRVGIRSPFNVHEIIKVILLNNNAIATSGTYIRGQHIYNPKGNKEITDIVSLSVIGPNIYEADRFATAAFAMGKAGIHFIETLPGFEGYMIDKTGVATMTSGFEKYVM